MTGPDDAAARLTEICLGLQLAPGAIERPTTKGAHGREATAQIKARTEAESRHVDLNFSLRIEGS
jgi:hypothetical protein